AAGVLKGGQVLDHAEEDVLAQVVQVARRHALAVEPADDQGAVQVGQVLPGVLLAGLSAEQQALPGLVHGTISPAPGRANGRVSGIFLTDSCKVFRRPPFLVAVGDGAKVAPLTEPTRRRGLAVPSPRGMLPPPISHGG